MKKAVPNDDFCFLLSCIPFPGTSSPSDCKVRMILFHRPVWDMDFFSGDWCVLNMNSASITATKPKYWELVQKLKSFKTLQETKA